MCRLRKKRNKISGDNEFCEERVDVVASMPEMPILVEVGQPDKEMAMSELLVYQTDVAFLANALWKWEMSYRYNAPCNILALIKLKNDFMSKYGFDAMAKITRIVQHRAGLVLGGRQ